MCIPQLGRLQNMQVCMQRFVHPGCDRAFMTSDLPSKFATLCRWPRVAMAAAMLLPHMQLTEERRVIEQIAKKAARQRQYNAIWQQTQQIQGVCLVSL